MKLLFLTLFFLLSLSAVSFRLAYLWRSLPPAHNLFGAAMLAKTLLSLEFAKSPEERDRGLSGRASLAQGSGMLFLFDTPGLYGVWMKDMRFPLDIVWLDGEKRVVAVEENALPSSYPQIFRPSVPARFILEVNAGFVAKNHIVVGDVLAANKDQE